MRENNRNSIEKCRKKLPQFTTMNVIDGQAGLMSYSSLTFYSLTIDNILNIIVLLILAGVTIATLTGENGILTKATESKEKTTQAKAEEMVSVAIGGLQTANLGDTSKITPEAIANQVMKDNNIENVVAEGSTFPTNIVFQDDGVKVWVDIDLSIGDNGSYDGIYSEEGLEGKIAPEDLFDYEIIDDGAVAATGMDSLPEKTVKITRIKPQYANGGGYNPDTGENDLENTNYGINYDNDVITKESLLVIPYEVDGKYVPGGTEGEKYKIIEIDMSVEGQNEYGERGYKFPEIETIIYPNTVEKISRKDNYASTYSSNQTLKKVELPNKIKEIPSCMFSYNLALEEVVIQEGVTNIENNAFEYCPKLTNITIPESVTTIGEESFLQCKSLTNIIIPKNVTIIGEGAFRACTSLASVIIPGNVESMGSMVFSRCTALTDVTILDGITTIVHSAFSGCTSLTNITIPESVTIIEDFAFNECSSLANIEIPKSVTTIKDFAFNDCSLNNITIPENIESMGIRAFGGCENLTSVTYKEIVYTSKANLVTVLQNDGVDVTSGAFADTGFSD